MARSKVTALGIDLFGVDRTVLAVRSDRKGLSIVSGMLEATTPADLVGCVAPADVRGIQRLLTPKTPGVGNTTVGVNEMSGKAEFAVANVSSADRLLGDRRKYAAGIKGLPNRQGKVDAPVVVLVPIPNRSDKKWDPYTAAIRPQLAVGVVDAVQTMAPAVRPAIDLRSAAALRAFLASDVRVRADYAAFVHVDALDMTTVLLSRGDVSFVQRSSGGLLTLARNLAAASSSSLDPAWTTLLDEGLAAFGDAGRDEVLSLVDMEVRGLDARLKTMWEASAKGNDRGDPPRVEAVYLSGPLADDDVALSLDLGGGIGMHAFRPVADLRGASPEIIRHAGRFTVAFGHALNSIALSGSIPDRAALATDITPLIELDLLPPPLRSESALPEVAEPTASGARSSKGTRGRRQLSPAAQQRLVAAMYLGGIGLLATTAFPKLQKSQLQKDTVALQRQAQQMSESVFEDSTKLERFRTSFNKAGSLRALSELATMSHQQLAALARAASLSNGQVWLTRVAVNPGVMTINGRAESLGSFAAYFSALKSDPAFVAVTYAITSGTPTMAGTASIAPTDTAGTFPFAITLSVRAPSKGTGGTSPLEAVLQAARTPALSGPRAAGGPGMSPPPARPMTVPIPATIPRPADRAGL